MRRSARRRAQRSYLVDLVTSSVNQPSPWHVLLCECLRTYTSQHQLSTAAATKTCGCNVAAVRASHNDAVVHSVAIDDVPWIAVVERCTASDFRHALQPWDCIVAGTALAGERSTKQLLPALKGLAGGISETSAVQNLRATAGDSINHLISLLSLAAKPSIRITAPKDRSRTSGGAIAFLGEVTLGDELQSRLAQPCNPSGNHNILRSSSVPDDTSNAADQALASLRTANKTSSRDAHGGTTQVGSPVLSLDYCEVRTVIDGVEALRRRLGPSDSHIKIEQAITPTYPPRCSRNPIQRESHNHMEGLSQAQKYLLLGHQVDRVCSDDVAGGHRIHAELVCCSCPGAGPVANGLSQSFCGVQARSNENYFFHTPANAESEDSFAQYPAMDATVSAPLDAQNYMISVQLYLEGDLGLTKPTTITVPRWSSDGQIWEVPGVGVRLIVPHNKDHKTLPFC